MLFSVIVFIPFYLLNLAHLRSRKIPIYSWGLVIAVAHLAGGVLSIFIIPVIFLLVTIAVEVVNLLMNQNERDHLSVKYDQEIIDVETRIESAQRSYEQFHCLITYTAEQDFDYRKALKILTNENIWHYVRGGLITSILIRNEDVTKAEEILGIGSIENEA
jgi:hypothetical protein